MQTKTKKVKVIGHQEYINTATGEIETFQVTDIEVRDFNFHKIWLKDVISILEIIGNKKTKVAYWVIDNLNKENELTFTYRQIAEETGISLETVRLTMAELIDKDFLRRKNIGCYVINPDLIFKGQRTSREYCLNMYHNLDAKKEEPKTDEQIRLDIIKSISVLQARLDELDKHKKSESDVIDIDIRKKYGA